MDVQSMTCEMEHWAMKAADSYQELAKIFASYVTKAEAEGRNQERIAQRVEENVCGQCPQCALCRECLEEERREAFDEAMNVMERWGSLDEELLPLFFKEECLLGDKMAEGFRQAMWIERMKYSAYNQMMEGKEALVYQLEETARYFRQVKGAMQRDSFFSEEQKRELAGKLKRYHIRVSDIGSAVKSGKGRELRMKLRCDSAKHRISMRLAEQIISEEIGFPVKESERICRFLSEREREAVFREEPGYSVLTGIARSVKGEQKVSGDSFSFLYEEDGEMAMVLSDGMGSGEEASAESESVLRLLERLLSAGFREESAIRMINSVLALRAEQKMFATLDISRINLYSGTCEFIKVGGAATYLCRGNWLESVEAKTLPIGMVQKVDYDCLVKKLYDGDYIIMMSDGVLDMIPREERISFLKKAIGEHTGQSPQVIAGRILNASLLHQNFEPRDDMTVMVCSVFGRNPCYFQKERVE